MEIKAYAKVNLILKVVGKYDNGYHELQMLNTEINIYDEIIIEKSENNVDELLFKNSDLNPIKDNLVLKCLEFIKNIYNIKDYYKITIIKNVPVGAGLGGGSSDAAAVIKYVLDENNIKITDDLLKKISKYGADIPYFLAGDICIVEGIGEKITKVNLKLPNEFVLINPNIYINTKEVYKNNSKISKKVKQEDLIEDVSVNGYISFNNDLEEACFKINHELEKIKQKLSELGHCVMSGSGSTMLIFGENIENIYKLCVEKYPNFFIKIVETI